jgi:hypothetical protein
LQIGEPDADLLLLLIKNVSTKAASNKNKRGPAAICDNGPIPHLAYPRFAVYCCLSATDHSLAHQYDPMVDGIIADWRIVGIADLLGEHSAQQRDKPPENELRSPLTAPRSATNI